MKFAFICEAKLRPLNPLFVKNENILDAETMITQSS